MVAEPGTAACIEQLIAGRRSLRAVVCAARSTTNRTAGLDVLDVGCGQGIDVVAVRPRRRARHRHRPDAAPRRAGAQSHVEALGLDADDRRGDAEKLPFADASFDRVSSNGVLHHTPDMPAALRRSSRVLRPGGEARILVYNRRSFHYWLCQVSGKGIIQRQLFAGRLDGGCAVARTSSARRSAPGRWCGCTARAGSRMMSTARVRRGSHRGRRDSTRSTRRSAHVLARRTRAHRTIRARSTGLAGSAGWYVLGARPSGRS